MLSSLIVLTMLSSNNSFNKFTTKVRQSVETISLVQLLLVISFHLPQAGPSQPAFPIQIKCKKTINLLHFLCDYFSIRALQHFCI